MDTSRIKTYHSLQDIIMKNNVARSLFLIFACLVIILYVAVRNNKLDVRSQGYLTISLTEYKNHKDPSDGMVTSILKYNISKKGVSKIDDFDFTSQYPLGIYYERKNEVYYSSFSGCGDQVYLKSTSENKPKQLTNELYAINYIFPRDKDIIIVSEPNNSRTIGLYSLNSETNKLINVNKDNDINVKAANYNSGDNQIYYTSEFSGKEEEKQTDDFNSGKTKIYIPPNHSIFEYDKNNVKKLYYESKNKQISALSGNEDFIIWKEYKKETIGSFYVKMLNKKTKEIKELETDNIETLSELSIDTDSKGFYFLGTIKNSKDRGIYYFDFATKESEILFTQGSNQYINNFILVK